MSDEQEPGDMTTENPDASREPASPPIVCDMTTASDTPAERLAEYRRLFSTVLIGRERTAGGIRFRFRAEDGVEAWVSDLAAREKACCSFFSFTVSTTTGDGGQPEIWWDGSVVDDEMARELLDRFYQLAGIVSDPGAAIPPDLLAVDGFEVVVDGGGVGRRVALTELGL
jgi:hypothetical protein